MSLKLPLTQAISSNGMHVLDADNVEVAFFPRNNDEHGDDFIKLCNEHAELLSALELCFSALRGKAQVDCEEMDDLIARCKEAK